MTEWTIRAAAPGEPRCCWPRLLPAPGQDASLMPAGDSRAAARRRTPGRGRRRRHRRLRARAPGHRPATAHGTGSTWAVPCMRRRNSACSTSSARWCSATTSRAPGRSPTSPAIAPGSTRLHSRRCCGNCWRAALAEIRRQRAEQAGCGEPGTTTVFCELPGVRDAAGQSAFWFSLGRHFYDGDPAACSRAPWARVEDLRRCTAAAPKPLLVSFLSDAAAVRARCPGRRRWRCRRNCSTEAGSAAVARDHRRCRPGVRGRDRPAGRTSDCAMRLQRVF